MAIVTTGSDFTSAEVVEIDVDQAIPEALLNVLATQVSTIEGDQRSALIPTFAADPAAAIVAEGAEITPTDPTLDEIEVSTRKVAVLNKVSNEALRGGLLASRLPHALLRSVQTKANSELIADLEAATLADGGEWDGSTFDAVAAAAIEIEAAGGQASAVVVNAATAKAFAAVKTGQGSAVPLLSVGAVAEQGPRMTVHGLPVYINAAAESIMVVSKDDVLGAWSPLYAAKSDDAFFSSDSVALRSTLRFGIHAISSRNVRISLPVEG